MDERLRQSLLELCEQLERLNQGSGQITEGRPITVQNKRGCISHKPKQFVKSVSCVKE